MAKRSEKPTPGDPTEIMTGIDPLSASLKDSRKKQACLMVVYGQEVGRKFWITKDVTVVGRDKSAVDVWIGGSRLSRRHFSILHQPPKYFIRDLGSTNGTVVNGEKIDQDVELSFGDKVQGGGVVFQFVSEASLETILVDRLKEDAFRDGLTQVYNKRILPDVERELFEGARTDRSCMAIVMFDIDWFKKINDSFGHIFGDQVLMMVAKTIRTGVVRVEDVMVRFGGEEFLLVIPRVDQGAAEELGERVRVTVESLRFENKGKMVPVTISVGVKLWDPQKEPGVKSLSDLIAQADEALYQSKQNGRNRVTVVANASS